jgi:hypothetical protein
MLITFIMAGSAFASEEVKPAADSQYKNWEFISDKDGIKTFQRDTDQGIVGFRGEMMINHSIEQVATILADMETRKEWMDEVVETRRIRMKDLYDRVEYNHTAVPWPFQDRDFVYSAKVTVNKADHSMIITLHSVEDAEVPPVKGVVRGQMHESRYYLKEIEKDKKSFVTVEIMVDPMGAIPKWVVRLKQKKWPRNTLKGLDRYLDQHHYTVPAEFKVFNP